MTHALQRALVLAVLVVLAALGGAAAARPAHAAPAPAPVASAQPSPGTVQGPAGPKTPKGPAAPSTVTVKIPGIDGKPSQSLVIILAITVLSIAPALLMLMTSFTKIVVVLSLTRNALGLQSVPPNQVLAGLALFLSLFIMSPTLSKVYDGGVAPYLHGQKTQSQAWADGSRPLKEWMLDHTRRDDIAMLLDASHSPKPANRQSVSLSTLIPAFVLSELKSAFIIGFVIFLPFLLIDLVVSSSLMSLGMMMVPPVMVSLPFKLLLFVLVDGWALIAQTLIRSYA